MKYIKMLGLLAVAAAALMAFAGTAAATVLTSPHGTVYTGKIEAESEKTTSLHGSFTTVSCAHSTVVGKVEEHGATSTAGGKVSSLTFSECNFPVSVKKAGTLQIHSNGAVTSSGAEITIETSIANCIFTTTNTTAGTFTGSTTTGKTATLDINSAAIPRTGHSIFCGSSGTWTGSYEVTNPDELNVD
jgi:hypothetical protein